MKKTITIPVIQITHPSDDQLPDILLPSHAELRLITASRAELVTLIATLTALLGDSITFSHPMPARRGWRVYASISLTCTE